MVKSLILTTNDKFYASPKTYNVITLLLGKRSYNNLYIISLTNFKEYFVICGDTSIALYISRVPGN